jgi:hypothetical protein
MTRNLSMINKKKKAKKKRKKKKIFHKISLISLQGSRRSWVIRLLMLKVLVNYTTIFVD